MDRTRIRELAGWACHRLMPSLVDSHTVLNSKAPTPFWIPVLRTIRYRALGLGLPLTTNDRRIASFRDRYRGRRAFIIGNGPSLNRLDLTLLKDEITFGVNSIYLNREKMGFLPTHYVVEDTHVAEDRADEINRLCGTHKWFGNYLRYCLDADPDVIWLNVRFRYDPYAGFPHFSRDAGRMLWVGGTVSYLCMQLAYYMGVSETYLVGFDHSYVIPADAKISGNSITSQSDDPNHFHPDYFGRGYRWHDPQVDRMEASYLRARGEFERAGRRIFNATAGGKLEVFPRVEYSSLFGRG